MLAGYWLSVMGRLSQLNANKDSVKWHKKSGKMLAQKLSAALKQSGILAIQAEAQEDVTKANDTAESETGK